MSTTVQLTSLGEDSDGQSDFQTGCKRSADKNRCNERPGSRWLRRAKSNCAAGSKREMCRESNSANTQLESGTRDRPCPDAKETRYLTVDGNTLECKFDNTESLRRSYANKTTETEHEKIFKALQEDFCSDIKNLYKNAGDGKTCMETFFEGSNEDQIYCYDIQNLKNDPKCTSNFNKNWYQELAETYCRNNPTDMWCKCYNVKNYKDVCMKYDIVDYTTQTCPTGFELTTTDSQNFIPNKYAAIYLQLQGAGCIGRSDEKKDSSWVAKNFTNDNCSQDSQLIKYDPTTKQLKLKGKVNDKELCLDHAHHNKYENGDDVVFHPCHGGLNQKWYLDSLGRLKTLDPAAKDLCLDKSHNDAREDKFQMYTCHNNNNQKFDSANMSNKRCVTTRNLYNDLPGCDQALNSILSIAQFDPAAKTLLLENPQCLGSSCPSGEPGYMQLKDSAFNQCQSMNICNQQINVQTATESDILASCAINTGSGSGSGSGNQDLNDILNSINDIAGDEDDDKPEKPKTNTTLYIMIFGAIIFLFMMMLLLVVAI